MITRGDNGSVSRWCDVSVWRVRFEAYGDDERLIAVESSSTIEEVLVAVREQFGGDRLAGIEFVHNVYSVRGLVKDEKQLSCKA